MYLLQLRIQSFSVTSKWTGLIAYQFNVIPSFPRAPCNNHLLPPRSCLPLLSTVSQTWQVAIERLTMSAIHLKSTDLAAFVTVYAQCHRRLVLAQLHYDAILPSYSRRRARPERERDRTLNNEALTAAIHDLFSLLHSWEYQDAPAVAVGDQDIDGVGATTISTRVEREAMARPISLTMNAYSLSDAVYRTGAIVRGRWFRP